LLLEEQRCLNNSSVFPPQKKTPSGSMISASPLRQERQTFGEVLSNRPPVSPRACVSSDFAGLAMHDLCAMEDLCAMFGILGQYEYRRMVWNPMIRRIVNVLPCSAHLAHLPKVCLCFGGWFGMSYLLALILHFLLNAFQNTATMILFNMRLICDRRPGRY
jgi:hypothetical protein